MKIRFSQGLFEYAVARYSPVGIGTVVEPTKSVIGDGALASEFRRLLSKVSASLFEYFKERRFIERQFRLFKIA